VTKVVVVDACALLDLIRAASRCDYHSSYTIAAMALVAGVEAQIIDVRLIVPDIVRDEFQRNEAEVVDATKKALRKARDAYRHAVSVASTLRCDPLPAIVDDSWLDDGIDQAQRLANRLLAASTIEVATPDDRSRANHRVLSAIAPSRRGKDSLADCIITELTLRLGRLAVAGNSGATTLLLSSNTAEYCSPGSMLRAELQPEFSAAGVDYVRNWGEAAARR
jgi:hypothetical protein